MKFTLTGKLPSKKNTTRFGCGKGGSYRFYQTKNKEMEAFVWQLKAQYHGLPLKGDCALDLEVWCDNRSDLNNQLTTMCDILEEAEIVSNDRQIKHIKAVKYQDIKNPRVSLEIKTYGKN